MKLTLVPRLIMQPLTGTLEIESEIEERKKILCFISSSSTSSIMIMVRVRRRDRKENETNGLQIIWMRKKLAHSIELWLAISSMAAILCTECVANVIPMPAKWPQQYKKSFISLLASY